MDCAGSEMRSPAAIFAGQRTKRGRSDSAFEEGPLPAAVGLVDIIEARIPSAAIVVGEDDDGIVVEPLRLERRHHLAHAAVERG